MKLRFGRYRFTDDEIAMMILLLAKQDSLPTHPGARHVVLKCRNIQARYTPERR